MDYTSPEVPLATVLWLVVWAEVFVAAALLMGVAGLIVCCGIEHLRETRARLSSRAHS